MTTIGDLTAALSATRQTARDLGIELPTALVDDLAALDAVTQRSAQARTDANALPELLLDCGIEGRDPAKDKSVTAAAHLATITQPGTLGAVMALLDQRRADTIRQHVPAILAAFAPFVSEADAAISTARDTIPGLKLNRAAMSGIDADHLTIFGKAFEAVQHLDQIVTTWQFLATAARVASVQPYTAPAMILCPDITTAALDALPNVTVAGLAEAGHRFELATVDDYRNRAARLDAERDQIDQRKREARESNRYAAASYGLV